MSEKSAQREMMGMVMMLMSSLRPALLELPFAEWDLPREVLLGS